MAGLDPRWPLATAVAGLVLMGTALAVGMEGVAELQSVSDPAGFARAVDEHPSISDAIGADTYLFAPGYLLLLVGLIVAGSAGTAGTVQRTHIRGSAIGTAFAVGAFLADEIENTLLFRGIDDIDAETTHLPTDALIDSMRVAGAVKWALVCAAVLTLVVIAYQRVKARAARLESRTPAASSRSRRR